ncbi:hypothetical protein KSP39_PZI014704 [Platanthera zijinensis]|uniref:Uncharacterized protein n=1 Tax=Platanthera zijinensis TaxID=2320716 RepID=A0AAP0BB10_9ASPA
MDGVEWKGSLHRIKKCAAEFLSMEDDLVDSDDDDDEGSWELIGRDIRLKSMFLYCDLHRVISGYSDDHKKAIIDLGNRFFDYMEELDSAVFHRSVALTQFHYSEATLALQELITTLLLPHSLD